MNIDYYNANAQQFFDSTKDADLSGLYSDFIGGLKRSGRILDAGCGSGRDTKHFLSLGYQVEAFDASKELARLASEFSGINVAVATFENFTSRNLFDGIWACASLLHVPNSRLKDVIMNLSRFLAKEGLIYFSLKYGSGERIENGRLFTDANEAIILSIMREIDELAIQKMWVTSDVRPARSEAWLNVLARRI